MLAVTTTTTAAEVTCQKKCIKEMLPLLEWLLLLLPSTTAYQTRVVVPFPSFLGHNIFDYCTQNRINQAFRKLALQRWKEKMLLECVYF